MDNRLSVHPVAGSRGGESFLVTSRKSAILVETGYSFSSGRLVDNIRSVLGDRKLDYILLTHSHYDHAGGTPTVKEAFPDAVIAASEICAHVFTKPGALAAMHEMNTSAAMVAGLDNGGPDLTSRLAVDLICAEGDTIKTSDLSIRVMKAKGHTRCCLSYYFEDDSLYIANESAGCQVGPTFQAAFLVSYKDALATIESIKKLAPKYILSPHYKVLSETESAEYPVIAEEVATEAAEFVLSRHRAGQSFEEIYEAFFKRYFTQAIQATGLQPQAAFEANAQAMIPRLIAEMS